MSRDIKINYSTFKTTHTRDYYKGTSFRYAGKWAPGMHYVSDGYYTDFVVYNQVLLACKQSHTSSEANKPSLSAFIKNSQGVNEDINSEYWDFVLGAATDEEILNYLRDQLGISSSTGKQSLIFNNLTNNVASGVSSVAFGNNTIAKGDYSHAEGTYNTENSEAIHQVGIGSSSGRKDAHTILNTGEHYIIGIGNYNGSNMSEAKDLASVISDLSVDIANAGAVDVEDIYDKNYDDSETDTIILNNLNE